MTPENQNDNSQKVNVDHLKKVRTKVQEELFSASTRKERIETLMQRKSSKKWKPRKVAKMTRRLSIASKIKDSATEIISNIDYRLSQAENTNNDT
jgi:hypothetical protein